MTTYLSGRSNSYDRPTASYSPDEPEHVLTAVDTEAIVLAGVHRRGGGAFERVRGPLMRIGQRPMIEFGLDWLLDGGLDRAVICANSSTAAVRDRLGASFRGELELAYFEDITPRGPAGCLGSAVRLSAAQTFVVVEASALPRGVDVRELLERHRRSGAAATVVVGVDRRRRGPNGEHPRMPTGIYVFEREVLERIPAAGYQDIKEGLLERMYRAGEKVAVHEISGLVPRVLDYQSFVAVSRWVIERAVAEPSLDPEYVRTGETLRHRTATVESGAEFMGPVVLGPCAHVSAGAVVIGPTTIGAGTIVGAGAVVSRSVVWDRCDVARDAVVDRCLLGDDARVDAGESLTSTLRLSDGPRALPVSVRVMTPVVPALRFVGRTVTQLVPALS
ncbi:MAG: sugar phosphate nucleotidyltransferase [Gemmatimonadaceae bacterium]